MGMNFKFPDRSKDLKDGCPDCGADMILKKSQYGKFFGCANYPECQTTHGATRQGKPLGVPANAETRRWRIRAHDAFDALWKKTTAMRRNQAYHWMQEAMGMSGDDAHIARFNVAQCRRLIALVELKFKDLIEEQDNAIERFGRSLRGPI